MRTVRAAGLITAKDLRQQLRNGALLIFGVVLPLGLAVLFHTVLGGPAGQAGGDYGVVDEDGGRLATTFTGQVLAGIAAGDEFTVRELADRELAAQLTDDGELDAAFVIPAGFTADVEAGRPATLTVLGDPDAGLPAQIAREIAQSYATDLSAVQLAVVVAGDAAGPAAVARQAATAPAPLTLAVDDSAARRELDGATAVAAGMAVFFLFFTAMISVSTLREERTGGTMARLLATPISRAAILAGKLTATVLIGTTAMAVLVGTSTLLLGADWGDPRGVAVLVLAATLAATGLLTLIATYARTTEQAGNWMSVIAVLFGLFGGSFVPVAQLGGLTAISYVTPHRWFLQGLADLAGGGLAVVALPVAVLLGFAVLSFGASALRIGRVVAP